MVRPVSAEFEINQPFGSMKTQGVAPSSTPNTVGWYVKQYGNYQPFGHAGADFKCPEGTPVHAIASGAVLWADWGTNLPGDDTNFGYRKRWYLYKGFPGIVTVIQHAGWIGVYAHLSAAHMNVGDTVTEGQVIGLSGGTGGVAPHLHVEALVDLSYKTSGGLIYGRTDPERFFGSGLAAMGGTITPPLTEEDDMFSDEDRALLQNLAGYVYKGGPSVKAGDGDPASLFGRAITTQAQGRDVQLALTTALPALLNKPGTNTADVAQAVAAAIPQELAQQVADELGKRLAR